VVHRTDAAKIFSTHFGTLLFRHLRGTRHVAVIFLETFGAGQTALYVISGIAVPHVNARGADRVITARAIRLVGDGRKGCDVNSP